MPNLDNMEREVSIWNSKMHEPDRACTGPRRVYFTRPIFLALQRVGIVYDTVQAPSRTMAERR